MRISRYAIAALAIAAMALVPQAQARSSGSGSSAELREAVTLDGISEHLRKLQAIANAHQGTRAAATIGYDQSASYVARKLDKAGYDVHFSPFDFPSWEENTTPELEQISPTSKSYVAGVNPDDDDNPAVDFITFEFSASGEITAPVVPTTDIVIPPVGEADGSTSGCEPGDFPGATSGAISLIQRGTCPFVQKLDNAVEAGAAGVILFNEGNPDRTNVIARGAEPYYPIPAVGASFAVGEELYNAFRTGQSPTVRMKVDATTTARRQDNVIADSPWGDENSTVVVGAHLDSVPEGPGINDNGSGTMTDLETAEQLAALYERAANKLHHAKATKRKAKRSGSARKLTRAQRAVSKARGSLKPFKRQSVRFAFWGAEEAGLIGSSQYVAQLSEDERARILLNLNFDMLASPNFARYVYDGNTDETEPPPGGSPPGSDVIEQVFLDYFESQDLPTQPTRVRRPLRLRAVHRAGDPGRWSVQRRRGSEDRGAGEPVRRRRGRAARSVLPRRVRHL